MDTIGLAADMAAVKVSDTEISVTKKAAAPGPTVAIYDYDFLINQKASIIKDANEYLAKRQVELDEVLGLIAQADSLGVTAKVMPQPLEDNLSNPNEVIIK